MATEKITEYDTIEKEWHIYNLAATIPLKEKNDAALALRNFYQLKSHLYF